MQYFNKPIPLSLYIHIPWCIRKCPYCDFNSHTSSEQLPEQAYMERLIQDLDQHLPLVNPTPIHSIFIGGGTPSLISPEAYEWLFNALRARVEILPEAEITLEANPGTAEQSYFQGYHDLGMNRLSLGIQSLQNDKLKALGRIHNSEQAINAVETARKAGFKNINLDLMYGLPAQNVEDALSDLKQAAALDPNHLSWYHLTLEPNTLFHKFPPKLPDDELIWSIQEQGQDLLAELGYKHYETSAYAKDDAQCHHNLNYWQFGDYLGIGAGAHGKITDSKTATIYRSIKLKSPKDYLDLSKASLNRFDPIKEAELPLEFMLNALRLQAPIPLELFEARTGLKRTELKKPLDKAVLDNFLIIENNAIHLTQHGHLFLNEVLELFMEKI